MRRLSPSPFGDAMREASYIGKVDRVDANTFAPVGEPDDLFE